ncbi:MAG: TSUP family transporter [Campylobacter sp.]|nr:TSUP family transporter [Campylobacter sp.]
MEFEIWHFVVAFLAAFFAGFVDAIAGGGGMIALPALLAIGVPPHAALATNKFQGTFGSFTAAANFALKGYVDFKEIALGIVFTLLGAILGTFVVLLIDSKFLNYIIPFLLLALLVYMIFSLNLGEEERNAKMNARVFYIIFGFLLGFYDGFFGPGAGSFWTLALVGVLGLYMKKAVAHTKVLNFTSNIVSLIVFIIGGQILWLLGGVMAVGQVLGGYFGSNMVMKKDVKFVRKILLFVVAVTILKILYGLFK